MNKWKVAFLCALTLLLIVTLFSAYTIIDQGITLTYQAESNSSTKKDLDQLIQFINTTDLSKAQIKAALKDHSLFEYMDFNSDTISLHRVLLVFENDKLKTVAKQW